VEVYLAREIIERNGGFCSKPWLSVFLRHGCRWGHHGHCQVVGLKTHGFPSTQYSKAAQAVKSLVQWIFPTINLDLSRISQPKFPGISHLVPLVMK